jgi:hypothetical protein
MKSQTPPHAKFLDDISQFIDGMEEKPREILLGGFILFFLLIASTTLLLAYMVFQPQLMAWLNQSPSSSNSTSFSQSALPTATSQSLISISTSPSAIPTQGVIPTSTPSCLGASLQLGGSTLKLDSIELNSDGSIDVPADTPGIAYWISNLRENNVFAISPTIENRAFLMALQGGSKVVVTWENCNSSTYTLYSIQAGSPDTDILLDRRSLGLIIYLPESPVGAGLTLQGSLAGETITAPATAAPSSGEVDAEISLLDTSASRDRTQLQVVVSIMNYGSNPITLTTGDISLMPQGASPLQISSSDPQLPQKIEPAESREFILIFPHPNTPVGTLRIFTVEYDLEGY